MDIIPSFFIVLLFIALTPGILLRIPSNGNKHTVALVHGIVFSFILCLAYRYVKQHHSEGFNGGGLGLAHLMRV
jgi:hypothetical protein